MRSTGERPSKRMPLHKVMRADSKRSKRASATGASEPNKQKENLNWDRQKKNLLLPLTCKTWKAELIARHNPNKYYRNKSTIRRTVENDCFTVTRVTGSAFMHACKMMPSNLEISTENNHLTQCKMLLFVSNEPANSCACGSTNNFTSASVFNSVSVCGKTIHSMF